MVDDAPVRVPAPMQDEWGKFDRTLLARLQKDLQRVEFRHEADGETVAGDERNFRSIAGGLAEQ